MTTRTTTPLDARLRYWVMTLGCAGHSACIRPCVAISASGTMLTYCRRHAFVVALPLLSLETGHGYGVADWGCSECGHLHACCDPCCHNGCGCLNYVAPPSTTTEATK